MFAGDIWLEKIKSSLAEAKVVILLLSKRSVNRPWVNFEAGAAWLANKTIIPCCFGHMDKEHLPHPYSSIHALNLRDQVFHLVESVHHHLGLTTSKPESPLMEGLLKAVQEKGDAKKPGALITNMMNPYKILENVLSTFEDVP